MTVTCGFTPREVGNTLASATWCLNLAVGALFGGVAGAVLGRDAVFVLNAASFLASAVLIRSMRFEEPHMEGAPAFHPRELVDFSPILEGMRYIRGDKRVPYEFVAQAMSSARRAGMQRVGFVTTQP